MLWHHNARVNSHQRWKQTRNRVCFHLWCELTSTMNVTEWQVSWNSCKMKAAAESIWWDMCSYLVVYQNALNIAMFYYWKGPSGTFRGPAHEGLAWPALKGHFLQHSRPSEAIGIAEAVEQSTAVVNLYKVIKRCKNVFIKIYSNIHVRYEKGWKT